MVRLVGNKGYIRKKQPKAALKKIDIPERPLKFGGIKFI